MISKRILAAVFLFLSPAVAPLFAAAGGSQVLDRELRSESLVKNKIGTNPVRKMAICLPPGY
jgi:hypothetical protein